MQGRDKGFNLEQAYNAGLNNRNLLNPDFVGSQNNLLLEEYPKVGGFASTQFYFEDK